MHRRPFDIFAEGELHQVLEDVFQKMETEIANQPDDYILNVNETEFMKYLVSKYSIENLELRFDDVTASTYEKEIPAQQLPPSPFPVDPSRTFRRTVVKYHIPFVGDDLLLHYKPNPRISWTDQVTIEQGCVCFELVDLTGTSQKMRADANAALSYIKQQLNHVRDQVTSCNESLQHKAHVSFQMRKEQILKRRYCQKLWMTMRTRIQRCLIDHGSIRLAPTSATRHPRMWHQPERVPRGAER